MLLLLACTESPEPAKTDPATEPRDPPIASADVVVVGAGASGLSAAASAVENGASVLVLEREGTAGGGGLHAANLWAAGTAWQADQGVLDDAEGALGEWAEFTGGEAPTPWVEAYVRGSSGTLDWLAEHGAVFGETVNSMTKTGSVPRIHTFTASPLTTMATDLGDALLLDSEVTGLVVSAGGAVIGVEVADGWIEARRVILATGGFARNRERVDLALPDLAAFHWYMEAWPGMTGSGQDMVEAVGVVLSHPERLGLFAHAVEDSIEGHPEVMMPAGWNDGLLVDRAGLRAPRNVSDGVSDDTLQVETYLERGPLYVVADADQFAAMAFTPRGFNREGDGTVDAATWAEGVGLPAHQTFAELATGIGVDPATLERSLADWNATVTAHEDPEFDEPMGGLTVVDVPPFRAVPVVISTQKSFGGAPLDASARVLLPDGTAIPGLYAAGELAGFLGGADLGHGWNGSVSACYFVGRAAGAAAALDE